MLPLFALVFLSMTVLVSAALDSQKTLGDSSAQLIMEIYTDFQDPFSARWYEQTLPELQEEYIVDKELKIVFRHFPLPSIHPDATERAEAAECAAEQGFFFAFAEAFYGDLQTDTNLDYYKNIANSLGVNEFNFEEFEKCFTEQEAREYVNRDLSKGQNLGVRGVPAFFIEDEIISGAQPFSEFKRVIDSLLNDSGGDDDDDKPKPEDMQREPIKLDNKKKEVHIIGYMGYNDPFSKRSWETINNLFKEFDRDEISFEFRNFPLTFQDSEYLAAQAGECVYGLTDYSTFFEYSDELMTNKDNDLNTLITEAQRLGVDSSEMERCLTEKEFLPEVLDDLENGEEDGIVGTPTFFINGRKVSGSQPYEVFEKIIRSELGEPSEDVEIPIEEEPSEDVEISVVPVEVEEGEQCVSGCQLGNSCLQFGQRLEMEDIDSYCSFSGDFEEQKQLGESCQNNYECFSNQCSNRECVDIQQQLKETQNLMQKILDWLKRIFG